MLTGRRFELKTPTMAIDGTDGKRVSITIPAGTVIKVVHGPVDGNQLVDVLWSGRRLEMFAIDLTERGTEILDGSSAKQ